MAFSAGSYHQIRYIPEATYDTDPTYSGVSSLRHTSCSVMLTKDTFTSAELRKDRQITDVRHGVKRVAGDVGIEFSFAEYDYILQAALFNVWGGTGNKTLLAGTTPYSFQLERGFEDIDRYIKFTGCMINSLRLTIPANAMVTGTIGIIGSSGAYKAAPMASGASVKASKTYPPFDSFTGAILEGGTTIAIVTSLELNLNNSLAPAYVVGDNHAQQITPGRCNVTGTLSAYFQDATLINKFINETKSTLKITLGSSPNYIIECGEILYTGGNNPVTNEGPIALDMPFQAVYSGTTNTNIRFIRSIVL